MHLKDYNLEALAVGKRVSYLTKIFVPIFRVERLERLLTRKVLHLHKFLLIYMGLEALITLMQISRQVFIAPYLMIGILLPAEHTCQTIRGVAIFLARQFRRTRGGIKLKTNSARNKYDNGQDKTK